MLADMKNDEGIEVKNDHDDENIFFSPPPGNGGMVFLADGDGDFLTAANAVAEFKQRAISAIMELDLPPETMQTVLRTIKAL